LRDAELGIGNDSDIELAHSSDNGASWSYRTALNTDAFEDDASDQRVSLASNGQGTWVAAWKRWDDLSPTLVVARSVDDRLTWSEPVTLAENIAGEFPAGQAVASDGERAFMVLADRRTVLASTDEGQTWSGPAEIPDGDAYFDLIRLLVAPAPEVFLAVARRNGEIVLARTTDVGQNWSSPVALAGPEGTRARDLAASHDGAGNVVIVWHARPSGYPSAPDQHLVTSCSSDGGATWTDGTPIHSWPVDDRHYDVDIARDGDRWLAVWADNVTGRFFYMWTDDAGESWSAARQLDLPGYKSPYYYNFRVVGGAGTPFTLAIGVQANVYIFTDFQTTYGWRSSLRLMDDLELRDPDVANDGRGTWLAAWVTVRNATEQKLMVSRSDDSAATWSSSITAFENADGGTVLMPRVVPGCGRHWGIVFQLSQSDFLERQLFVARTLDDGQTWLPAVPLHEDAIVDSCWHRSHGLARNSCGDWMALWPSAGSGVLAAVSRDGGASWSAPAVVGATCLVTLTADSAGRWITAWTNSTENYIGLTTSEDGVSWTELSRPVEGSEKDLGAPLLCVDPAGRVLLVYTESEYFEVADEGWVKGATHA
jgi:hypothetical protein